MPKRVTEVVDGRNRPVPTDFRISPEVSALLALARRDPPSGAGTGLAGTVYRARFQALAQHHEVFGLALVALERTGQLAALPAAVGAELARSLTMLRRQAALWDLQRDAVIRRLAAAEIPVLLLKGAALRLSAYRDPAER